jgi:hypothetical protein
MLLITYVHKPVNERFTIDIFVHRSLTTLEEKSAIDDKDRSPQMENLKNLVQISKIGILLNILGATAATQDDCIDG